MLYAIKLRFYSKNPEYVKHLVKEECFYIYSVLRSVASDKRSEKKRNSLNAAHESSRVYTEVIRFKSLCTIKLVGNLPNLARNQNIDQNILSKIDKSTIYHLTNVHHAYFKHHCRRIEIISSIIVGENGSKY